MARVSKVTSIERLVGGTSVHLGTWSGPEAEAFLRDMDRQVAERPAPSAPKPKAAK